MALNVFDVQDCKLRVEYKKVLQAGEKERIEREKAIGRMRSTQLKKEKSPPLPCSRTTTLGPFPTIPPLPPSAPTQVLHTSSNTPTHPNSIHYAPWSAIQHAGFRPSGSCSPANPTRIYACSILSQTRSPHYPQRGPEQPFQAA
jgi:hypothetical protein